MAAAMKALLRLRQVRPAGAELQEMRGRVVLNLDVAADGALHRVADVVGSPAVAVRPPAEPLHGPRVVGPERAGQLRVGLLLEQPHRVLPREEHGPLLHRLAPLEALPRRLGRPQLERALVLALPRTVRLVERPTARDDEESRLEDAGCRSERLRCRGGGVRRRRRRVPGGRGRPALCGHQSRVLCGDGCRAQQPRANGADRLHGGSTDTIDGVSAGVILAGLSRFVDRPPPPGRGD